MLEIKFLIDENKLLNKDEFIVLVKAKANFQCERCNKHIDEVDVIELIDGRTRRKMHSHHKDRDANNNRLSNGECLCEECHDKEHKNARIERINKQNKSGQHIRGGQASKAWLESLTETERIKWLKNRAAKIRDARIKNGTYGKRRIGRD